jgi:HEAT repeat protein
MSARVDKALIALFEGKRGAEERLAAYGPEAFHRVMKLINSRPVDFPERLREQIVRLGRASIDIWSSAIAAVAWANPRLYVDQLGAQPGTLDMVILARIEDPRVVAILRRALDCDDWLIRYHAVLGLAARPEPEARQHLRAGLGDVEEMIRREAARALIRKRRRGPISRQGTGREGDDVRRRRRRTERSARARS